MKGLYKYSKNYPLYCYNGNIGDFIELEDGFLDVGGYEEFYPLSEKVLKKIKEKYKDKYKRMFWGYILFRGNPNLTTSNEYILDSICHPYFEIVNGNTHELFTVIYYKNHYYLTYLDMFLQEGMTKKLLSSDYVITEVSDGTIGMTLVEDGKKEDFKKVKLLESKFYSILLDKTGKLGEFIKRMK